MAEIELTIPHTTEERVFGWLAAVVGAPPQRVFDSEHLRMFGMGNAEVIVYPSQSPGTMSLSLTLPESPSGLDVAVDAARSLGEVEARLEDRTVRITHANRETTITCLLVPKDYKGPLVEVLSE